MARLPDLDTLGQRPVPVSRRSIASNPRAGAVGDALAGFGNQAVQIGQKVFEKEDRLAYASAKSALLRADIATRKELETDPDYETWESRYNEKMATAREQAAGLIRSRSDRALFEQDAGNDILRGAGELSKGAFARRVDREVATGRERLFELHDLAQDAPDDASREAIIGNASDLIAGLRDKGYVTAEVAGTLRRDWTQDYVVRRVEALRNMEDYEGAEKFFEANRSRLDSATEIRVEGFLVDALNNREALVLADEFVHSAPPATPGADPDTPPAQMQAVGWASVATSVADAFGLKPVDVASVISYETAGTFSPTIMGGKGGNYMGLIQFGPEERRTYGITDRSTPAQWSNAITRFLNDRGFRKGMGVLDLYSTINAGTPGRYNASDGNGTVRSHAARLLSEHRGKAEQWLAQGGVTVTGETSGAPGQRHDLGQIYTSIDERAAAEGWTPEKTERIKAQAARLVQRDDALLDRNQADAYEAALAKAETLGNGFTDPSQLGDAYYRASETQQATLRNMAEANAAAAIKAAEPDANGGTIRSLHRMAIEAPGQFANVDLRPYRPFMTPGEFDEISTSQAKAKEESGQWSPRTGIQTAIQWGEKFGGVPLDDDEDRYRVYRYIEDRARQFRTEAKGKEPAESDFQRWFGEATAEVRVTRAFAGVDILAADTTRRAFETVSPNFRKQIVRNFKSVHGREPNEDEIQQWFERMGRPIGEVR